MIKYMVYNETNEISNIHGYVQCDMSYREIKESAYGRIYITLEEVCVMPK